MKLKENISLAKYSSYRTGGEARFLLEIKSVEDFEQARGLIKANDWKNILVLGAGTNMLISDEGWDGLVIKNDYRRIEKKQDGSWLIGSGTALPFAARFLADQGYSGLERLANVPGSVGGAIRGNAEAWRQSISDKLREVVWFDWDKGESIISKAKCDFSYRGSIFKQAKDFQRGMIKEGIFDLTVGDRDKLMQVINDDKINRLATQPDLPSCGCFFKNILLDEENWQRIEKKLGSAVLDNRQIGDNFSTGRIIDFCGLKGRCVGGACVSEKHANFIVNRGGASSTDIWRLAGMVQKSVFEELGIKLELEVQTYGKFD